MVFDGRVPYLSTLNGHLQRTGSFHKISNSHDQSLQTVSSVAESVLTDIIHSLTDVYMEFEGREGVEMENRSGICTVGLNFKTQCIQNTALVISELCRWEAV